MTAHDPATADQATTAPATTRPAAASPATPNSAARGPAARAPAPRDEVAVRAARDADVAGVCAFGEAHVRPHYAPLIGVAAADEQVRRWWNPPYVQAAVAAGDVVVAEQDGRVVGVAQHGRAGPDHVVYKLYVAPDLRGCRLGPRLLAALVDRLPADVDRLLVEHVAANRRAAAFYEREGFVLDRVDPHPSGDPALATVWRVRSLRG